MTHYPLTPEQTAFQHRYLAAQLLGDRMRSIGRRLGINSDASITLHHATSAANAAAISREGQFRGNTWFARSPAEALRHARLKHGKDVVTLQVRVDPRDIEFSTGTGEFYAPHGLRRSAAALWSCPGPHEQLACEHGRPAGQGAPHAAVDGYGAGEAPAPTP